MQFEEINREEYTNYASKSPLKHFLQTVEMEQISLLKNHISRYVGIRKGKELIAATRLIVSENKLGKKYFYAPRGPLLDYNDYDVLSFFTKEIKKYIKKENGYDLRIEPLIIHKQRDIDGNVIKGGINNVQVIKNLQKLGYIHNGFNIKYNYSQQVRWVFCLDLYSKTEEQIFNEMKATHRTRIRKTERLGIEIKSLKYNELDIFKKITAETSMRRNFKDRSLEYYQTMYNLFKDKVKFNLAIMNVDVYIGNINKELNLSKDKSKEVSNPDSIKAKRIKLEINDLEEELNSAKELKKQGDYIPLSAAMFLMYGDEIEYLFSGSDDKYMKYYGQYALQWDIIKYGITNNYRRYNFLGITGNFDKNNPEYGVYEFKRGFNGYVEEYIGDFDLPVGLFYQLRKLIKH